MSLQFVVAVSTDCGTEPFRTILPWPSEGAEAAAVLWHSFSRLPGSVPPAVPAAVQSCPFPSCSHGLAQGIRTRWRGDYPPKPPEDIRPGVSQI